MTLILHAGANEVDYDTLRQVDTPRATASHVPIPHHSLVDMVRFALLFHKHEIIEEHHAIMPDPPGRRRPQAATELIMIRRKWPLCVLPTVTTVARPLRTGVSSSPM